MTKDTPISGRRETVERWVHGRQCVVQVKVEAVWPDEDPSELCFEPAVLRFLDQLQAMADGGDASELAKHGAVYVRRPA